MKCFNNAVVVHAVVYDRNNLYPRSFHALIFSPVILNLCIFIYCCLQKVMNDQNLSQTFFANGKNIAAI